MSLALKIEVTSTLKGEIKSGARKEMLYILITIEYSQARRIGAEPQR